MEQHEETQKTTIRLTCDVIISDVIISDVIISDVIISDVIIRTAGGQTMSVCTVKCNKLTLLEKGEEPDCLNISK